MNIDRTIQRALALIVCILLLAPVAMADDEEEWSQFRKDPEHSALATESGVVQTPLRIWNHAANAAQIASPAVIAAPPPEGGLEGARIFGASYRMTGDAEVFALDEFGDEVWSVDPTGVLIEGGYLSSPAVGDLDQSGNQVVVIGHLEGSTLYKLDAATGSTIDSFQMGSTSGLNRDNLASSPTLVDVTGDGDLEIVFGGSRSSDDGTIFILDKDLDVLFEHELNAPVWSSPLVADIDGGGDLEIVVSTGVPDYICLLAGTLHLGGNDPKTGDDGGRIYAFKWDEDAEDWEVLWDQDLSGPTVASPALGDMDGSGTLDIVVGAQGPRESCTDPTGVSNEGSLHVFNAETGQLKSVTGPTEPGALASLSSPLVADLDGDGTPIAVVGTWDGLSGYEMINGDLVRTKSVSFPLTPEGASEWVAASPAAGDVTGDGRLEVVAVTLPLLIDEEDILNSELVAGLVFAVDGESFEEVWSFRLEDDGGMAGPVLADWDDDGRIEVLVGTGLPIVGETNDLRSFGAANPVVESLAFTPDEPLTLEDITFLAEISHKHGDPQSVLYDWDFGDGGTSTEEQPVHVYGSSGDYTVSLTLSDPDPEVAPWVETVTITVENRPPELTLTAEAEVDSLNVTLQIAAEDPDGEIDSWSVDFGDGTPLEQGNGDPPTSLDHTYPNGDTYTITAELTDDDGASTTEEEGVTVNRAPVVSPLDDEETEEGELLEFTVQADDPDGDPLTLDAEALPAGATFTDHGDGEGSFEWVPTCGASGAYPVTFIANDAQLNGTAQITIEVVTGTLDSLQIEDEAGSVIGNTTLSTDDSLSLHARGYNAAGCLIGDTQATWDGTGDLDGVDPGPATNLLFDPVTADTSGTITADAGAGVTSESGMISVVTGVLSSILIEDEHGEPIGELGLTTDDAIDLYARGYDSHGNLRGDELVTWGTTGDLDAVDPGPAMSVPFDPTTAPTSGTITADAGDAVTDETGTITIEPGEPVKIVWLEAPGVTDVDTGVFFEAQVQDQHDNPTGDSLSYAIVSGPGSIDPSTGDYTPDEVGTASIRAENGGLATDTGLSDPDAELTVTPGVLDEIRIEDVQGDEVGDLGLTTDESVTLYARGYDSHGNLRGDESVTWGTTGDLDGVDPGPATSVLFDPTTASTSGTLTADAGDSITAATGTITVSAGQAFKVVWETAPEQTDVDTPVVFSAQVVDAAGNPTSDIVVYSVASGAGSIDPDTGEYGPVEPGTASIRAGSGDLVTGTAPSDGDAELIITPGVLDEIRIEDVQGDEVGDLGLTTDESVTLYARGYDSHGNLRGDESVTWGTTGDLDGVDPGLATSVLFDPTTAQTSGTITADAGDAITAATGTITVALGEPALIVWLQAPASTDVDTSVTFTAQVQDAQGNPTGQAPGYTLLSGPGAIDPITGVYTPDQVGSVLVRAASGALETGTGLSDPDAGLTVNAGPLAELRIETAGGDIVGDLVVDIDDSVRLFARGYDSHGNLRGVESAAWGTTGDLDPVSHGPATDVLYQAVTGGTSGKVTADAGDGITAQTGTIQVIAFHAPQAVLLVSPDPVPIIDAAVLDGSGSTQDHGELVHLAVDPGDGSPPYEVANVQDAVFTHEYAGLGEYVVQLVVTNDEGFTDTVNTTVHVAGVHNPDSELWYVSVQDALDDAKEGDTIELHPGLYGESVAVETAGLELRATEPRKAVLAGTDGAAGEDTTGGAILRVDAADVNLTDLRLTPERGDAVVLGPQASGTIRIEGNEIEGVWGVTDHAIEAMMMDSDATLLVLDNDVHDVSTGITVDGEARIQGNSLRDVGVGIQLGDDSRESIVSHNFILIAQTGIATAAAGSHEIGNNTVVTGGGTGILLEGGEHVVRDNSLLDNGVGLHVRSGAGGHSLLGNRIDQNDVGVLLDETESAPMLRLNRIQANQVGLVAESGAQADARDNWWGSPGGPLVGDGIEGETGAVSFVPWCLQPGCPLTPQVPPLP